MAEELTAIHIMQKDVICVSPSDTLAHVWDVMSQNRISGVPVVSEDNRLVGVFSQTDLLQATYRSLFVDAPINSFYLSSPFSDEAPFATIPESLEKDPVSDYMSLRVVTVEHTDSIPHIVALMRDHQIHRVVVTELGIVLGVITTFDLLKILERQ